VPAILNTASNIRKLSYQIGSSILFIGDEDLDRMIRRSGVPVLNLDDYKKDDSPLSYSEMAFVMSTCRYHYRLFIARSDPNQLLSGYAMRLGINVVTRELAVEGAILTKIDFLDFATGHFPVSGSAHTPMTVGNVCSDYPTLTVNRGRYFRLMLNYFRQFGILHLLNLGAENEVDDFVRLGLCVKHIGIPSSPIQVGSLRPRAKPGLDLGYPDGQRKLRAVEFGFIGRYSYLLNQPSARIYYIGGSPGDHLIDFGFPITIIDPRPPSPSINVEWKNELFQPPFETGASSPFLAIIDIRRDRNGASDETWEEWVAEDNLLITRMLYAFQREGLCQAALVKFRPSLPSEYFLMLEPQAWLCQPYSPYNSQESRTVYEMSKPLILSTYSTEWYSGQLNAWNARRTELSETTQERDLLRWAVWGDDIVSVPIPRGTVGFSAWAISNWRNRGRVPFRDICGTFVYFFPSSLFRAYSGTWVFEDGYHKLLEGNFEDFGVNMNRLSLQGLSVLTLNQARLLFYSASPPPYPRVSYDRSETLMDHWMVVTNFNFDYSYQTMSNTPTLDVRYSSIMLRSGFSFSSDDFLLRYRRLAFSYAYFNPKPVDSTLINGFLRVRSLNGHILSVFADPSSQYHRMDNVPVAVSGHWFHYLVLSTYGRTNWKAVYASTFQNFSDFAKGERSPLGKQKFSEGLLSERQGEKPALWHTLPELELALAAFLIFCQHQRWPIDPLTILSNIKFFRRLRFAFKVRTHSISEPGREYLFQQK
jgi:hypothetical protein